MSTLFLQQAVQAARRDLSVYWPLHSFAAVNPLWDRIDESFFEVARQFGGLTLPMPDYLAYFEAGSIQKHHLNEAIDEITKSYAPRSRRPTQNELLSYADERNQSKSFNILYCQQIQAYSDVDTVQWVAERCYEWLLSFWGAAAKNANARGCNDDLLAYWYQHYPKRFLDQLDCPGDASALVYLQALLDALNIPSSHWTSYLRAIARYLYGWASLTKWLENRPDNPWLSVNAPLEAVFVIWLGFEYELKSATQYSYSMSDGVDKRQHDDDQHYLIKAIWQTALEKSYYQPWAQRLAVTDNVLDQGRPKCQLICCIDVRSERLRRHLEHLPGYETYGCAGFFGFPFDLNDPDNGVKRQCPALLTPEHIIDIQTRQQRLVSRLTGGFINALDANQNSFIASFALFEVFGVWHSLRLAAKTLFTEVLAANRHKTENGYFELDKLLQDHWNEVCDSAYRFLSTMGLVERFAPEIVICAHQSDTENNPYAGALDCGACGGNSGVPNAMVMSRLLNKTSVRQVLSQWGIHIPDDTRFIPACHHTTTDEVTILSETVGRDTLCSDLNRAAERARWERQQKLPLNHPFRAAKDWAELIPEWGLANNAAMIIAPRRLTKKMNLQGRVFLHSYEPDQDVDGSILQAIMTGPMVVAHWINMQYYCSTVEPGLFGAGNKAIHNPVPGIGVMEGNISDLKPGLPNQSVQFKNNPIHTPLRLTVFIKAPEDRIAQIINGTEKINQLTQNGWLRVIRI